MWPFRKRETAEERIAKIPLTDLQQAVIKSLEEHPEQWQYNGDKNKLFNLNPSVQGIGVSVSDAHKHGDIIHSKVQRAVRDWVDARMMECLQPKKEPMPITKGAGMQ